jgi:uncharacterized protein involved in outer membrane biogenesis
MKRIVGLLAVLLSVLLLLAAGLVALLMWVSLDLDLTAYKSRVVEEINTRTGLRIAISGDLTLRLGPELRLQARGLTLTGPTAGATPLLDARIASLTVPTTPLLGGRLEPEELFLSGAKLNLTRNRAGRGNWDLPTPMPTQTSRLPVVDLAGTRLRVLRSQIGYRELGTGKTWQLRIDALEARRSGEVLKLALDGDLNGEPVRLSGHTAPLIRFLAGGRTSAPLPVNLRGRFLGLDVHADGDLALPDSKVQTKASLTLKAKNLAGLRHWLRPELAALGPLDAELVLSGGGGLYALSPLSLRIGEAKASGRANLDLRGPQPALDLDLTLAELDLRTFLPEQGPQPDIESDRVFSTAALDLGWMDATDIKARVQVTNLAGLGHTVNDLDLTITLAERHLSLTGTGKAEGGRDLALELTLNGQGEMPALNLDLKGDKLHIAPLLAGTGAEGQIKGDLDAGVRLSATGNTEAALAASLSGKLVLLAEDIEAPVADLDRMGGGAKTIFGQILTPRSRMARVECALVAMNFEGGRTRIKGVIDTPNSTVTGEGSLDLVKETIELRLVPQAKGVTLAVSTPVLVSGPLADPDYQIEPGGLISSLSDIAARTAVPQLLLVDAFGQTLAENPCGQILTGKIPSATENRLLDGAGQAAETLIKAPVTVLEGVGGAVKGVSGAVVGGAGGLVKGVGGLIKGVGDAVKGVAQPETEQETAP